MKRWGRVSVNYESGRLAPDARPAHVRPHRAGLRRDEPDDDRRARPALAPAHRRGGRPSRATTCSTPAAAPATSRSRAPRAGGRVTGLDFSEPMLERARRKAPSSSGSAAIVLELPFEDASFDAATVGFGVRNVDDLAARPRRAAPRAPSRRPARDPRDHPPARRPRALLSLLVRQSRAAARQAAARWVCLHVSPGQRAPLPRAEELAELIDGGRLSRGAVPALRRRHRRAAHGGRRLSALAEIREAPGLDAYLGELEDAAGARRRRLPRRRRRGRCGGARRRRQAAAAAARATSRRRRGRSRRSSPASQSSSSTSRRSCTTTSSTVPRLRRGHASAWSAHGPEAARAAGDYLFARAFAELAATRSAEALAVLANATLCLARGEAMQRSQRFDPDTTIDAYLERCTLKTGKLFEAACRLAGGSGVVRARARRRVPDHRRHPRLLGRDDRDRQDRRHRSA